MEITLCYIMYFYSKIKWKDKNSCRQRLVTKSKLKGIINTDFSPTNIIKTLSTSLTLIFSTKDYLSLSLTLIFSTKEEGKKKRKKNKV